MTALLAIRGTGSIADCYGFLETETWTPIDYTAPDPVQIAQRHMSTIINVEGGGGCQEVSFDSTDIQGTFAVAGDYDGLLLGIWLSTPPTVTASLGDGSGHIGESSSGVPNWDPTPYVIPDLRPADNAYMFRRGRVWPPGEQAHDYP